ncbi:MAG: hypothetical protein ACREQ4_04855 [Candidatus Binataceae bacterium]
MRAVKLHAAATDRKMKDVVAEAIASGLAASNEAAATGKRARDKAASRRRTPSRRASKLDPALEALFAAGDAMAAAGVDFKAWAKHSRDVWR